MEIAWFAALCDDDYEFLGVPDPVLRSSFEHCREIVLRAGYRVHVIVRESERQAREAARRLLSRLDPETGDAIRRRSLGHASAGVRHQAEVRDAADAEGFVEDLLWTGIGRARSGCGAALVGDPDQILAKLRAYIDLGVETFILSGYPHARECDLFARYVLPHLDHAPPRALICISPLGDPHER